MWMRAAGVALVVGTTGCADPIEGRWEGDELACGIGSTDRVTFVVDSDLNGEGEYCDCRFTFVADNRGEDVYRLDLDFDGPCFVDDGKYDCDLERDGERLDCGPLGDYTFVGD